MTVTERGRECVSVTVRERGRECVSVTVAERWGVLV